jgi:spore coat polysaccharide biosynthesis predicted glycosyltransferase SpsG
MMRMLFRADAYPAIGTGDLKSLIHFSRHPKLIADGWECHFMVRDHEAARNLMAVNEAANVEIIPVNVSTTREISEIERYTKDHGIDAVLFEITDRRLDTFDLSRIDAVIGAVDFYNWIPEGLDLVINWDTNSAGCYSQQNFPGTDFFLGPQFVFLHPNFLTGRRWQPVENDLRPVVVAMGGADEFNLTYRILSELILKSNPDAIFTALIGAGFTHFKELRSLQKQSGRRLTIKHNVTDMCREFLGARYVFGAGGLTAFELVALGTPCSLVACYPHQEHRCRTFADMGWARYLGHRSELGPVETPPAAELTVESRSFVSRLDQVVAALEAKIRRRCDEYVDAKYRSEKVG